MIWTVLKLMSTVNTQWLRMTCSGYIPTISVIRQFLEIIFFLRDTDGARGALYGKKSATSMNYGVCTGHHLGENCHSSNFVIALFTQVSWHSCVYSGKSSTYTGYIPYTAGNYTPYICVASCQRYVHCLLTTWWYTYLWLQKSYIM